VSVAKGLVPPDGLPPTTVLSAAFGAGRVACVGGPAHAQEMVHHGAGLVAASSDEELTRSLAHAGHYPAIDVLQSVSRLVGEIVTPDVANAGQQLRAALAVLREKEDLVAIGAYQPGSDPALDTALSHRSRIEAFLRQAVAEHSAPSDTDARLLALAASLSGEMERLDGEIPDAEEVHPGQPREQAPANLAVGQAPAIPALGLSI